MARSFRFERCLEWLEAGLRLAPFIIALLMLGLATMFLLGGPELLQGIFSIT